MIIWATFFQLAGRGADSEVGVSLQLASLIATLPNPGLLLKPFLIHTRTLTHIYTHMHISHTNIHIAL